MFIIETKRLFLRKFEQQDAKVFFQLNANPKVLKYTGDQPFQSTESASEFILNYYHYDIHGYGRWSVVLKSTNECIGWCGLENVNGIVDVGFRFLEKFWNQGYATESAEAILNYGFGQLDLPQIIGRCSVNHAASAKVLQKIGMEWWKKDLDQDIGHIDVYRKVKN